MRNRPDFPDPQSRPEFFRGFFTGVLGMAGRVSSMVGLVFVAYFAFNSLYGTSSPTGGFGPAIPLVLGAVLGGWMLLLFAALLRRRVGALLNVQQLATLAGLDILWEFLLQATLLFAVGALISDPGRPQLGVWCAVAACACWFCDRLSKSRERRWGVARHELALLS